MSYRCTQPTKATEWNHQVSDETLLDLAVNGSLPKHKVREYIKQGRIKIDMLLSQLKFGQFENGAQVLKFYYPELFLG